MPNGVSLPSPRVPAASWLKHRFASLPFSVRQPAGVSFRRISPIHKADPRGRLSDIGEAEQRQIRALVEGVEGARLVEISTLQNIGAPPAHTLPPNLHGGGGIGASSFSFSVWMSQRFAKPSECIGGVDLTCLFSNSSKN